MRSLRETPRPRVRGLVAAALAGLLGAASFSAYAAPVTIQDGFVQAGVNDLGTLGSGGNNPPGILYDPTGTGSYGINDFLTPGTPFEGYSVTGGGGLNYCANNAGFNCANNMATASPTSGSATTAEWTGMSLDGNLTVSNAYTLTTVGGRSAIAITTTLTNNSGSVMTGVQFLRTLDPDPDVNAFGSFFTENTVFGNDQACGTGPQTGETICIYSFSPYTHKAGVDDGWSTDPAVYLGGSNDGDGDYAIGVAFMLGDLGVGQSFTFEYGYALGGTLGDAVAGVPEPSALVMFGLGVLGLMGLAGLDANRRRRRATARC